MSDETKPVAAPAKQAPKQSVPAERELPPKTEAPAPIPVNVEEGHQLADVVNASEVLLGVLPEVVAGAAHKAGWEMTDTVTVEQAKQAVSAFLTTPA